MKKILIVEDEYALREVYKTLFVFEKFKVYEAHNGAEALGQLDKVKPDIILLDLLMPVMGGLEFLEVADIRNKHPNTKVLVLSNLSDPKTLDKIMEVGANKYVLKSNVSPAELAAAVRSIL